MEGPQLCGGVHAHLYPAVIHNQAPLCCYNGPGMPVLLAARLALQTGSAGGGWTPMLLCNLSRISIWPRELTRDYSTSSWSCFRVSRPCRTAPPRATVCFPFEEKRGRIIHVGRRKLGNRSGLILVYKYRRLSLVHICCALCDGHISAHGDTLLLWNAAMTSGCLISFASLKLKQLQLGVILFSGKFNNTTSANSRFIWNNLKHGFRKWAARYVT